MEDLSKFRELLKVLKAEGVVSAKLPDGTEVIFGHQPAPGPVQADDEPDEEIAQIDRAHRSEAERYRVLLHSSGSPIAPFLRRGS